MNRLHAAFFIVFFGAVLRIGAAQATLSASTATATIGERIDLRVVVRADSGVTGARLEIPVGDYEIVGRRVRPAIESVERRTFEEIVTIAFFKTGDFTVGPFRVELLPRRAEATNETTGPLTIHIRSLLGDTDKDIQPLKEPFAMSGDPRHLLPYAAVALLALLLASAALLLRKRLRRRRESTAASLLPPELELEQAIRELRAKNLWQSGEFRLFFIALSRVLKRFIERAYAFNAEECTTMETVAGLKPREPDASIVVGIEETLTQADLVKFARRIPEPETLARIWRPIDTLIAEHKRRRQRAEEAVRVSPGR